MCLQGTILRIMNGLELKGPGNHSLWLTFQGALGLDALLVELWKQGLFKRLVRGVSLWGSCTGQASGLAGPPSRVCDQQTLRAPCYEVHSIGCLGGSVS